MLSSALPAWGKGKAGRSKERVRVKRDEVAGGAHWRVTAPEGVIHIWRPPGYRRKRAGIVAYVHGYHVTADRAWAGRLYEQFKASKQNALFIVVDGPSNKNQHVKFKTLSGVLRLVQRHARLKLPRGHIVIMGHSAGFRTIVHWLDYRFITHVILLDALYSREEEFNHWMTRSRHHDWHRLVLVARDTKRQSSRFLKSLKRVVKRDAIPKTYKEFTRRERGAPVLYLRSQYGHSALVTNGKVIPLMLRLTRLRRVR
jgi:hypothetical protein